MRLVHKMSDLKTKLCKKKKKKMYSLMKLTGKVLSLKTPGQVR